MNRRRTSHTRDEMMQPAKKMLNLLGTKKHYPLDSDGDGHANVMDCQPYNKNKQGWLHDKVNKLKAEHTARKDARDFGEEATNHSSLIIIRTKSARVISSARLYLNSNPADGLGSSTFWMYTPPPPWEPFPKERWIPITTSQRAGWTLDIPRSIPNFSGRSK